MRPATPAMDKLVTRANSPDTEIAWPAIPSVAPSSAAMGVSRLTGMNSAAISIATQSDIDPTALQICGLHAVSCGVAVVMCLVRSRGWGGLRAQPIAGATTSPIALSRTYGTTHATGAVWMKRPLDTSRATAW